MYIIELYLRFCRLFDNLKIPYIRFIRENKSLNEICISIFDIEIESINKAFSVFSIILLTFLIMILSLFLPLVFSITLSVIISILISSNLSKILFNEIEKEKKLIDILINFFKLDYIIIRKTYQSNQDLNLIFVNRLKTYRKVFKTYFLSFFKKVQQGYNPEEFFKNIITPSDDFNFFLRNFESFYHQKIDQISIIKETSIERSFRIHLKELDTKLSIFFFVGLFFPIGLCFLSMFLKLSLFLSILFIPCFAFFFRFLNKKFLDNNTYLIGKTYNLINHRKEEVNETLRLFKIFSLNLKNNLSPERSFITSYNKIRSNSIYLDRILSKDLTDMLYLNNSLGDVLKNFKKKLNSPRISLIIDMINHMLSKNSKNTGEIIENMLKILEKQLDLEEKLISKLKSQKFKVIFFLLILPLILGLIGGMMPIFFEIIQGFYGNRETITISNKVLDFKIGEFLLIIVILGLSNIIVNINFLKIIYLGNNILILLLSNMIYLFTFFLDYYLIPFF